LHTKIALVSLFVVDQSRILSDLSPLSLYSSVRTPPVVALSKPPITRIGDELFSPLLYRKRKHIETITTIPSADLDQRFT
jgi:hypothetical protein